MTMRQLTVVTPGRLEWHDTVRVPTHPSEARYDEERCRAGQAPCDKLHALLTSAM